MKFSKVLPKEKQNRKTSLATVLKAFNFIKKETSTQVFSCEYSKGFRDSLNYRTTPVATFELSFSISKEL